ncbi:MULTISPECIES: hypothetical protein [unclassified Modestobacter]|uniref:hypothetical protein n=1 Tax=unclassified Modestobacter TaxID=2643866 RepID=UPI0022AA46C1|nr:MULTISPECIES: hypothetical protein [unclassified Modestobacter]MCZ2826072.1 hypothetical protein [Modestobacter sp. VKM Ac-2981]MCZ2852863.1 hypothetical protein [Modestobacter sp. VKM Ac-2982]
MAFSPEDAAEYRKRVLTPFKNQRLPELQAGLRELKNDPKVKVPSALDIVDLYDVFTVGSDAAAAAQVAGVSDVFNKSHTNKSFNKIGPTLTDLHQLLAERNPDLSTAAFWQARLGERSSRGRQRLTEFVEVVRAEAGVLGLVTKPKLEELARGVGIGGSVPLEEIEAAVQAAGIDVVAPVTPPPTAVPAAVLKELGTTSCASIVDAIFLQAPPAGFRVLDGFAGAGGERLSLAMVVASREITEKRSSNDNENGAIKKALGVLGALSDDRTLEQVVQAWFIEVGRQAAQIEPALALALKRLTDTRLDRRDAARILTLFAGGQSKAGFPEVQQRVAAGELKDARRLFEALCDAAGGSVTDVRTEAQKTLEGAERRVAELRTRAQTAVETGDLATAAQALNEALTICTDDDSLAEMQAALPPAAPLNLVVTTAEDGRTVQVTWEPGFGSTADVHYVVVCRAGTAPKNAHDGTVVAKDVAATRFDHRSPELATQLYYGVAATRGAGFSPVVSRTITVLPPVRDVRVDADPDSVALSWNPPAGARAVRVVQVGPDGRQTELKPNSHGSVSSVGLTTGATYTYLLTALYATAAGELAAQPCRVTGTPRGQVKPVPFVNVRLRSASSGDTELEVTWAPVTGFDVEIWHTAGKPRWSYGSRVPMDEIAAEAVRLTGASAGGGRREGVRGVVAPGLRHYVAVTRDGDSGVIGQSNEVGVCPRLSDVTAERFHDVVLLSWPWPGEAFDVQASWEGPRPGERRISRPQYAAEGGLRIATGTGRTRVRLQTVPASGEEIWSSPETVVEVDGAAPGVRYTTSWHKRLLRPPGAVTLTFACEERPSAVPVVVVGQAGQIMPYAKDSGVVLAEETLDLSTGTASLTVELRGLGPAFWVRAFSQRPSEHRLIDPPTRDLRGA